MSENTSLGGNHHPSRGNRRPTYHYGRGRVGELGLGLRTPEKACWFGCDEAWLVLEEVRLSYSGFRSFSSRCGAKSRIQFIWSEHMSRQKLTLFSLRSSLSADDRGSAGLKRFQNETPNICSHHTPASSHTVTLPTHQNHQPPRRFVLIFHPHQKRTLISRKSKKMSIRKWRKKEKKRHKRVVLEGAAVRNPFTHLQRGKELLLLSGGSGILILFTECPGYVSGFWLPDLCLFVCFLFSVLACSRSPAGGHWSVVISHCTPASSHVIL